MTQNSIDNFPCLDFVPPAWLQPSMVQTAVASFKFRKRGPNPVTERAKRMILDCGDGVRLSASYSAHDNPRAHIIFLHGWEGSEDSTYVLSCARYLFAAGCSVFRLNFRDHGDSHALNEELFHSARLDEVFNGVGQGARLAPDVPVVLVGFSLGGNFALRIVRELTQRPEFSLAHVVAISPVINPQTASPTVDQRYLIRRYFRRKLFKSLDRKQAAFPDLYNFDDLKRHKSIMKFTQAFLPLYTPFERKQDYFSAYRIGRDDLAGVNISTSIIMSEDDPVVPAHDLGELNLSACVELIMLKYGGHNGFFQSLRGPTWYDRHILNCINGLRE